MKFVFKTFIDCTIAFCILALLLTVAQLSATSNKIAVISATYFTMFSYAAICKRQSKSKAILCLLLYSDDEVFAAENLTQLSDKQYNDDAWLHNK